MTVKRLPSPTRVEVAGRPADYVDAFALTGAPGLPRPREAAAALLAGSSAAGGLFAELIWHGALGLHVAPVDPTRVAGWTVLADTDEHLDLVVDGRRMQGRMTFESSADGLTWTTALRYGWPGAEPTWRALGPVHRALVPCLLTRLANGPRQTEAAR